MLEEADLFMPAAEMPRAQQASSYAPDAASCDETARATPQAWLDCISELEEAGFTAAVENERRLLAETFPDVEIP